MELIDLTMPIPTETGNAILKEWPVMQGDGVSYTGMVYDFFYQSNTATYIDFPGHIKEIADTQDAGNYPVERLFRVSARVVRLDRESGSGAVTAADLAEACPTPGECDAVIVNALDTRRYDEIENRSVWLSTDAVGWIIATGAHLLVSDIYESPTLHGVFTDLFSAGISTVCCPTDLHLLTSDRVLLTCLPGRFEGATQLPCRVLAELDE